VRPEPAAADGLSADYSAALRLQFQGRARERAGEDAPSIYPLRCEWGTANTHARDEAALTISFSELSATHSLCSARQHRTVRMHSFRPCRPARQVMEQVLAHLAEIQAGQREHRSERRRIGSPRPPRPPHVVAA
jgi:hypothetical protein